jgi:hypothetical protein
VDIGADKDKTIPFYLKIPVQNLSSLLSMGYKPGLTVRFTDLPESVFKTLILQLFLP